MKIITFITGNSGKLAELQAFFPYVQGKKYDLPEMQSLDVKEIVRAKLTAAVQLCDGSVIVDDTAFYLECFERNDENGGLAWPLGRLGINSGGLPGPLIKWFLQTVGNTGLADIAHTLGKTKAVGHTVIGFAENKNDFHFFEGVLHGEVVAPQGTSGFGWDHIFLPDGYEQTFARMGFEQKNKISPRAQAAQKLKTFLSEKDS